MLVGGLSDGPRMASDIDVFVTPEPDRAVEVFRAIAQLFGELGNRENRGLARMRYLVQELGPERFRAELATRTAFPALEPAGEAQYAAAATTSASMRSASRACATSASTSPSAAWRGGTWSRRPPGRRVRRRRAAAGHRPEPDPHRRPRRAGRRPAGRAAAGHPLAQRARSSAGWWPAPTAEFCRFAIVETKARAASWAASWTAGSADEAGDGIVRMHFSGCPASCAQPQIADIDFQGKTAHRDDQILEAVDVGLGGSLGTDAAFADWVEGQAGRRGPRPWPPC